MATRMATDIRTKDLKEPVDVAEVRTVLQLIWTTDSHVKSSTFFDD